MGSKKFLGLSNKPSVPSHLLNKILTMSLRGLDPGNLDGPGDRKIFVSGYNNCIQRMFFGLFPPTTPTVFNRRLPPRLFQK